MVVDGVSSLLRLQSSRSMVYHRHQSHCVLFGLVSCDTFYGFDENSSGFCFRSSLGRGTHTTSGGGKVPD